MTGKRKEWSRSMTENEKKKYKVRMRMVEEDVMGEYKDVPFTSTEYEIFLHRIYVFACRLKIPNEQIVSVLGGLHFRGPGCGCGHGDGHG